MGREASQFDIPVRQLLATNTQSRAGVLTDIGEAKIIHTIFGRAKVRVIRKQDQIRRTWLMRALAIVVMVLAAASWRGWIVLLPQTESLQSTAPSSPIGAKVQATMPVFQAEPTFLPATRSPVESQAGTPPPMGLGHPTASQKNVPQPQSDLRVTGKMLAKPITAKPQVTPLTNNHVQVNQVVVQQPPKLPLPSPAPTIATPSAAQPIAPAVARPLIVPPVANKTEVVVPPVEPVIKKPATVLLPADDTHPAGSINEQP